VSAQVTQTRDRVKVRYGRAIVSWHVRKTTPNVTVGAILATAPPGCFEELSRAVAAARDVYACHAAA